MGTFRLPLEVGLPNALAIDGTTRYVGCYLRNPNPQRDSIAGVAKLLLPELGEEATLVEPCQPLPNRTTCIAAACTRTSSRVAFSRGWGAWS